MDFTSVLIAIISLIAGIGIFLVACTMMSSNLESVSSNKLKAMFAKVSHSRWLGVGIGAFATALIQSSGATTVMVIGFVNVGIMSLAQAATIIYGANIGTTITAQIVALGLSSGGGISTTTLFGAFAGIGAFAMMFAKSDVWKKIGGILAGFGMLFVGLSMMSGAMDEFAQMPELKSFLASVSNPILLVLLGAIFTAIIQSSSVMTSIAITMVVSGLISLNQGIYLTLGSNIGSCVVAIIAGMTSGTNAKRTALMHLLFNCFGVVMFMIAAWILNLSTRGAIDFGYLFETMFPSAPQLQMAMFHTIFNVITVFLIIGFTNHLVNLVCRIIPNSSKDDAEKEEEPHYFYVDEKMLRTPIIAVPQVKLEIENMAAIAMRNFDIAIQTAINMDFSDKKEFQKNELQLNFLNRALVTYIVQLNNSTISEVDRRYLTSAIRSISDIERVGDYAENIVEYTEVMSAANERFPESTCLEFEQMKETITTLYNHVMKAYNDQDMEALRLAKEVEEQVDDLTEYMEKKHIDRLTSGEYSATVGAQYLEFASDSERIADHLLNVARTIKDLQIEQ